MSFQIINNPIKTATLDNGDSGPVGFSYKAKHPGCNAHFSFIANPKQSQCKMVIIDDIKYQVIHRELSPHIPGMWTFHIREMT